MPYHGIKFTNKITSSEVPRYPKKRIEELKYWCRQFHLHNFTPSYRGGSCGNLSFRMRAGNDSFVITGSRIGLKDSLSDDCFVKVSDVDLEKGIVYSQGKREPSSESMLHFAIYRQRKDINAVFHGHSKEILACKIKLPETKKETPYGTVELVNSVLDVLNGNFFLIMKNHGFISLGKTTKEAGKLSLETYKECYN